MNQKIEILTIADCASVCGGKVCLIGSFDRLGSEGLPVNHGQCCVVAKVQTTDPVEFSFKLSIEVDDAVIYQSQEELVKLLTNQTYSMLWKFSDITFEKFGLYRICAYSNSNLLGVKLLRVEPNR